MSRLKLLLVVFFVAAIIIVGGAFAIKQTGLLNKTAVTSNTPPKIPTPPKPDGAKNANEQKFEGELVKVEESSFVIKDSSGKEQTFKYLKDSLAARTLKTMQEKNIKELVVYGVKAPQGDDLVAVRIALKTLPPK